MANKLSDITNLATNNTLDAKVNEVKNKNTWYNNHNTNTKFKKLRGENFAAILVQANLTGKNDIADSVEKTNFDDKLKNLNTKITSKKKKYVPVENELTKLQTFGFLSIKKQINIQVNKYVFLSIKFTLIMMEHNFI